MENNQTYISPLASRYAAKDMLYLFSAENKFRTWRRLWIALAEAEQQLGLDITDEQINQMKAFADNINYEVAQQREREVRHDVMAHVYAFGQQCPAAKPIIHLGATSCFVGDNSDLIIMHNALELLRSKIAAVIKNLSEFALKYKDLATLAYTHFQPAQPTTVGKRACLWIYDLILDLREIDDYLQNDALLGCKGTTGTQASFLELFGGDYEKVRKLDLLIAEKMGFKRVLPVSGQTYTRKIDSFIMNILSGIAASAAKFSNDIRLLQHLKEIEEPFEDKQIGSSAMAYKRNPMRCERIAALARYVIANSANPQLTASAQWFERTLDDSANKRISMAEGFLATDGIIRLYGNVSSGLVVYPKVIEKHLMQEMPFMITENIIMDCVKRGGDRQELHEHIRIHSQAAAKNIKEFGAENDLISRIAGDSIFGLSEKELLSMTDASKYCGCAALQTEEFIRDIVSPVLSGVKSETDQNFELNV